MQCVFGLRSITNTNGLNGIIDMSEMMEWLRRNYAHIIDEDEIKKPTRCDHVEIHIVLCFVIFNLTMTNNKQIHILTLNYKIISVISSSANIYYFIQMYSIFAFISALKAFSALANCCSARDIQWKRFIKSFLYVFVSFR